MMFSRKYYVALANVAQDHLLRPPNSYRQPTRTAYSRQVRAPHFPRALRFRQSFEDIRTYLRDEFDRIHHEHRQTMTNIPTPWPSPETLDKVVEKSSGYFIYASTLVKFIDDEDSRPAERLEVIQNLVASEYDPPFDALDQLYMQILLGVPYRYRSKLCDILCVVANFEFCAEEIERLLHLQPGDVLLILRRLHSLLNMPPDAYVIHVHHASFLDFLHDPQRSWIFHVGLEHRINLARSVLEALPGVGYDIQFAWKAGNLRLHWATFVQSVPPSTELLPLIESVSPDFIWERSLPELFGQRANPVLSWLKTVRPLPEDLIRDWEAYRFMEFYEYSNHNIHTSLLNVRDAIAQGCPDHVVLSPSLQVSRTFQAEMDDSLQVSTYALRELFAQFPQLVRIFQARRLLSNNRSYVSEPFGIGLFNICILLDIPWNDMTDAISSLRSIVEEDPRKIATMLMVLPTLCREHPEHTSRDLGLGFLRLIRQIGDHELPLKIWWVDLLEQLDLKQSIITIGNHFCGLISANFLNGVVTSDVLLTQALNYYMLSVKLIPPWIGSLFGIHMSFISVRLTSMTFCNGSRHSRSLSLTWSYAGRVTCERLKIYTSTNIVMMNSRRGGKKVWRKRRGRDGWSETLEREVKKMLEDICRFDFLGWLAIACEKQAYHYS
ncbi:hypothetical protein C8J57DRAFT_1719377 [Mycena rebaudengoi]|nr:hypothetical protein C8J57DRAFT_1719377 [Mycena rebaudengoi]